MGGKAWRWTRQSLAAAASVAAACAQPAATPAEVPDAAAETAPADVPAADAAPETAAPDVAPGWTPTASSELYGLWLSDDGETVRALQFAQLDNQWPELFNLTPVYRLYRHPKGTPPVMVQRGEYVILAGPTLSTTPRWAEDPSLVGKASAVPLLPAAPGELALQAGAGARVYVKQPSPLP